MALSLGRHKEENGGVFPTWKRTLGVPCTTEETGAVEGGGGAFFLLGKAADV